jgi:ATP-dependent DNA helicase RecG
LLTDAELLDLVRDLESDRVERKASLADKDRIGEAICAFANDLPNHQQPGVVFVGITDAGGCAGTPITDELLLTLADMRTMVVPFPSLTVQKRTLDGCEIAVVTVQPSDTPPVRFRGRTWVRVGPRRAAATPEDERRLTEKRRSRDLPFDLRPLPSATLDDLDLDLFVRSYLPAALSPETLAENNRSVEHQLAALRFVTPTLPPIPTVLGMLTVGKSPQFFLPGAYIQYLRIGGLSMTDPILDQKRIDGALGNQLRGVDEVLQAAIAVATDFMGGPLEVRHPDYPLAALQQLVRNAIMHRSYEGTNAPVRLLWYADRIEIQNPGGPYGQVTRENFGQPGVVDYRNPDIAEAMRDLGFAQRFGFGIPLAREALAANGNPPPEFLVEPSYVLARIRRRP